MFFPGFTFHYLQHAFSDPKSSFLSSLALQDSLELHCRISDAFQTGRSLTVLVESFMLTLVCRQACVKTQPASPLAHLHILLYPSGACDPSTVTAAEGSPCCPLAVLMPHGMQLSAEHCWLLSPTIYLRIICSLLVFLLIMLLVCSIMISTLCGALTAPSIFLSPSLLLIFPSWQQK